MFTNNRGGHILRGNFTRDALRPAVIRAGLTLFEVQQRLGHKSPTLTANIYTHLMRERFEEGRGKLENYMRDNRKPTPPSPQQVTHSSSADSR